MLEGFPSVSFIPLSAFYSDREWFNQIVALNKGLGGFWRSAYGSVINGAGF
jgi:hypothetical protein